MSSDALKLNEAERRSNCWTKVEAKINLRLAAHRKVVENPRHTEAARFEAACRIDELKELLKLAQPVKEQPDDPGE